jgi:hypothetical protein
MKLEFASTAQEEAEKINAQTGIGLVTDQAFWEKQGVVTGEDLAFSILSQTYSDAYKSLHGIRPRWAEFKTVQEIEDALDELDQQAAAMAEDEAEWAKREAEWEKERQELEDLSRPGLDLEYEKVPQQSGMGRRMEGRAPMKITKRHLRRIIKEEKSKLLNEQWGNQESMSPLIQFAQAFSGLGGAVSEQVVTVVNAYIENDQEAVYDINPNALDMALERLRYPLQDMGEDGDDVMEALDWAKGIFEQGDAEVEADARAAGDR